MGKGQCHGWQNQDVAPVPRPASLDRAPRESWPRDSRCQVGDCRRDDDAKHQHPEAAEGGLGA